MKPSRSSRRRHQSTTQLSLPVHAPRILSLDAIGRVGVVAILARLLFEAARSAREREDTDDAS